MADIDLSGQRILIVDDVAFARETLKRVLLNLGGPTILEAQDGLEAEEILDIEPDVQFVIADFNMPKSNGLELMKTIRSGGLKAARSLPVAMLTGYSDQHLVEMALALDVNAFIIKPVSKVSLSRRLKKMLDVSRDTSWLKTQDIYADIPIVKVKNKKADVEPAPTILAKSKKAQVNNVPTPQTGKGRLSGKFDEADLAEHNTVRSGKFNASDLANLDLIRQISAASRGTGTGIAPGLAHSLEQLAGDVGGESTERLVSLLGYLVDTGSLSVDKAATLLIDVGQPSTTKPETAQAGPLDATVDAEEIFVTLNEIPNNALLSQELQTPDGSTLMTVGTPLTAQVVAIIQHLDEIDKVSLHTDLIDGNELRGLYVKTSEAPGVDYTNVTRISPENLKEGAVIARDVYMTDGRRYAVAGTALTARLISLIRDLEDLGHLDREIWVTQ